MTAYGDDLRARSRADGQRNIEREVERLRAEVAEHLLRADSLRAELRRTQDENERLYDELHLGQDEAKRLREELDNCKGGGAYRDEVGSLTSENERLRAAVQAVRDLAVRAVPGLSGPPKDCTNNCWTGDCDCSGNWVALAWSLDPAKVLAALGGEQ